MDMNMKTIAIINQKGGVGKTATSLALSYAFANRGLETLLIDLDPSANATKGLNFAGSPDNKYVGELLLNSHADTTLYAYPIQENLSLIPSHIRLALQQRELTTKLYRESLLNRALSRLLNIYEFIIIDCCPTLNELTINAIYSADELIIPVTYEEDALEGLNDLFNIMHEIKGNNFYNYKILRIKKDSRKKITNHYIEKALTPFIIDGKVFDTIIRQDESVNQAKIERQSIFLYAPLSNAATDFVNLAGEIIND